MIALSGVNHLTKKFSQREDKTLRVEVRELSMMTFRLNYAGGSYPNSGIIAGRAAPWGAKPF
jgi:hypothetical protein